MILTPQISTPLVRAKNKLSITKSMVKLASVYTAECLAIKIAVNYANPTNSYVI